MPVLVFAEYREKLQAWLYPTLLRILCPYFLLASYLLAYLLARLQAWLHPILHCECRQDDVNPQTRRPV